MFPDNSSGLLHMDLHLINARHQHKTLGLCT